MLETLYGDAPRAGGLPRTLCHVPQTGTHAVVLMPKNRSMHPGTWIPEISILRSKRPPAAFPRIRLCRATSMSAQGYSRRPAMGLSSPWLSRPTRAFVPQSWCSTVLGGRISARDSPGRVLSVDRRHPELIGDRGALIARILLSLWKLDRLRCHVLVGNQAEKMGHAV